MRPATRAGTYRVSFTEEHSAEYQLRIVLVRDADETPIKNSPFGVEVQLQAGAYAPLSSAYNPATSEPTRLLFPDYLVAGQSVGVEARLRDVYDRAYDGPVGASVSATLDGRYDGGFDEVAIQYRIALSHVAGAGGQGSNKWSGSLTAQIAGYADIQATTPRPYDIALAL